MNTGSRPWCALAALLALGTALAWTLPPNVLDWQPTLAAAQPWRAFTAAAVHYSPLHLGANLAGLALVAAYGWAAQLPPRAAAAWAAAWPLTQIGLWWRADLAHYGGLSGVLHAGVAVAALHLTLRRSAAQRLIGLATLAALGLKVLLEAPWGAALRERPGWDIAVAPLGHASGLVAGLLCAAVAEAVAQARRLRLQRTDHD